MKLLHWFFLWNEMEKEKLVELGYANKPHGLKGGFLFKLYNTQESVLAKNIEITLFPKESSSSVAQTGELFIIKTIQFGNKTICYLKGIEERNPVEAMLPFSIFYPRDKFPKAAKGEVYIADLVNLKVMDSNGKELGVVHSLYDNGAQTVLKLKLKTGDIELPFVKNFFPEVNLEEGIIIFTPPEFEE